MMGSNKNKENSEYHKEYYKKEKKRGVSLIFLIFILTIGAILFFAFYENFDFGKITVNTIKIPTMENAVAFSSMTNIPSMELSLNDANLSISVLFNNDLSIDGKKISLNRPSNSLTLEGFSGDLSINENLITILNGNVLKIIIDGMPITNENGDTIKISSISDMKYGYVEINSDAYLKTIEFTGTGSVSTNQNTISITQDNVLVKDFFGKISAKNGKLLLSGIAAKIDINGANKKLSIFK